MSGSPGAPGAPGAPVALGAPGAPGAPNHELELCRDCKYENEEDIDDNRYDIEDNTTIYNVEITIKL